MQLSAIFLLGLHAFVVYVQATSNNLTTIKLEKFTMAEGTITDATETHPKVRRGPIPAEGDVLELDPNDVTAAIPPGTSNDGTMPQLHGHVRGRTIVKRCPFEQPWICDGVTCMNKFTHSCCAGGHLCEDPTVCIKDQVGEMSCR